MVPLSSIFPQLEPLLLYTVWADTVVAITVAKAKNKIRNAFMLLCF
jgi:hypothetical protein